MNKIYAVKERIKGENTMRKERWEIERPKEMRKVERKEKLEGKKRENEAPLKVTPKIANTKKKSSKSRKIMRKNYQKGESWKKKMKIRRQ